MAAAMGLAVLTGAEEADNAAAVIEAFEASRQHLSDGRIEQALRSAERAHRLARTEYGPDHASTGTLTLNYGNLLVHVGADSSARPVLDNALRIFEQHYGSDALELVPILLSISQIQRKDAQLSTVRRALAIQKTAKPDDRVAYAYVAAQAGKYMANTVAGNADAVPILTEALKIYQAAYGDKSQEVVPVLMSLGDANAHVGNPGKQMRYYKRALKILKDGDDPVDYADMLHQAGVRVMNLSASRYGFDYMTTAHEIFQKELGSGHVKTAYAELSIAHHQISIGRYRLATASLLSALEVFRGNENYRNHELKTLSLLVKSYERLGERDAATPYCQAIGQIEPWTEDQEYLPIEKTVPVYPQSALRKREQGYVTVQYTVDEYGVASEPVIVNSQGSTAFHKASLDAVRGFRYAPRYRDGQPVATAGVRNRFTYVLDN